jgi:hypothetical protein
MPDRHAALPTGGTLSWCLPPDLGADQRVAWQFEAKRQAAVPLPEPIAALCLLGAGR